MESDFFDHSESMTLVVTEAQWLDKSREPVKFDLKNGTAEWMFPDVTFSADLTQQGYVLNFDRKSVTRKTEDGFISEEIGNFGWHSQYFDENGQEYYASTQMSYSLDGLHVRKKNLVLRSHSMDISRILSG